MPSVKNMLSAAAGAGGAGENIESLFHTQVYTGTNANQQVTNGVDLSNEGGLLWFKSRSNSDSHRLIDTERGLTKALSTHLTAQDTNYNASFPWLTSFNSDGYTIGNQNDTNFSGYEYVGWTFRKAKKFFTVVTYTGNGSTTGHTISHDLGADVGFMTIKRRDTFGNWWSWHRGDTSSYPVGRLNTDGAWHTDNGSYFGGNNGPGYVAPTSTNFMVGGNADVNANGGTYVAYLWAHNNNDGGFGENGDKDIIKCGSYTGGGGNTTVTLGFEPQWFLAKRVDSASTDWYLLDNMRGMLNSGDDLQMRGERFLSPNSSSNEGNTSSSSYAPFTPLADGFKVRTGLDARVSSNGGKYIYIAIRRGPFAVPTNVRDVFDSKAANTSSEPNYPNSSGSHDGFPVDMAINIYTSTGTSNRRVYDRMRSDKKLMTDSTSAEQDGSGNEDWDYMDGFEGVNSSSYHAHMWRRAPGYFDTVCYDGNNTAGRTITHNLGVVPEMIWIKNRGYSGGEDWTVYHKGLNGGTDPEDYYLRLNANSSQSNNAGNFNDTAPTSTVFTVGADRRVNGNVADGNRYIAHLFATAPGVSKVGSYTGNGSFQVINCGFSSSVRYVLIKRTDSTGDWCVWDTERGLTQGADPYIELNTTDQQTTGNKNYVYPDNSGFGVQEISGTNNPNVNVNNATYIFYAVAYPS